MTDQDLEDLRTRAATGDRDTIDQLVELAGELRRLAAGGNSDASDMLAEAEEEQDEDS